MLQKHIRASRRKIHTQELLARLRALWYDSRYFPGVKLIPFAGDCHLSFASGIIADCVRGITGKNFA